MLKTNPFIWLSMLTFFVGTLVPVQAGINAQFGRFLGHPVMASLFSFMVATIFLLSVTFFLNISWPSLDRLNQCPWWYWLGGLVGAMFITATIIIAPRLGATTMLAIVVAGQMISSLIIDHYGLIGFTPHPASLMRWIGILFLCAGVFLVQRF